MKRKYPCARLAVTAEKPGTRALVAALPETGLDLLVVEPDARIEKSSRLDSLWHPTTSGKGLTPMTTLAAERKVIGPARLGLAAIFFANGFGIGSWAASIAPVKAALSLSDAQLSIALLAMAAGAIVMMPLAGLFAARLGGPGRLLRVSSILFAVALCLPGFTSNLFALAATTLMLGLANGLMEVPMNTHATTLEQRWGAAIMSSFHAAWSCGGLAGATLAGLLIRFGANPQWQLVISGLVILLIVVPSVSEIGAGDVQPRGHAFVLPERSLLGLCLIALLALLVEGAMTDWSTVYLTSVLAFTPAVSAAGYAVYAGSMLTGRLFGDLAVIPANE